MMTMLPNQENSVPIFGSMQGDAMNESRIRYFVDADGALATTGAASNEWLAVRSETIYTSRGEATFGLPAGRYTIFAGRGFEYSLAQTNVTVAAGETVQGTLSIRREVPTNGYVACDTHCHTLTHSGHGEP